MKQIRYTPLIPVRPGISKRMKRAVRLLCLCSLLLQFLYAQGQKDTVRVMQYNLLNYGSANNLPSYKNPRLLTVIGHVRPDILSVNEIGKNAAYSQDILNNVLGSGWQKGNYLNVSNEVQTNMLFWKSDRFALKEQSLVASQVRDIIAYRLYHKAASLAQTQDTTFITVIVAHLKAGSGFSDSMDRIAETQAIVSFLNSKGPGNILLMGDLNLYTSAEQAYQNLVANPDTDIRLYDPVNRPGDWNSNAAFADVHTQSTRTASLGDGGVTGGLDDRFDHILVSGHIINNTSKIRYLPGSYKTIGQDGLHLNKALTASPANTSVPPNVLQALYEMSDHLPVTADLVLDAGQASSVVAENPRSDMTIANPAREELHIRLPVSAGSAVIKLCTVNGTVAWETTVHYPGQQIRLRLPDTMPGGIYLVQLHTGKEIFLQKILLNN